MEEKVLENIKKAEKEATGIIERAEKKRENIILEAGKQAEDIEKQELEKTKNEINEKVKKFEQRNEDERDAVLGENRLEMDKMRKQSDKNVRKAIESLKKEFFNFLEK